MPAPPTRSSSVPVLAYLEPPATATPPSAREIAAAVPLWLHASTPADIAGATAGYAEDHWQAARWGVWRQGIGPLLFHTLSATGALADVAPSLRDYLHEDFEFSTARNKVILADLEAVLRAAGDAGMEVVPLKGSLLATEHYALPALRPMADIDVLVGPSHEAPLAAIAGRLDYRPVSRSPKHLVLSRGGKAFHELARWGEHPENPIELEIHSRVMADARGLRYEITDELWSGSRPGALVGAPARVPTRETLALHLLLHAGGNAVAGTLRAIHLFDLALLGSQVGESGWQPVGEACASSVRSRLAFAALALAERVLGRPVGPRWLIDDLRRRTPPRLVEFLAKGPLTALTICGYAHGLRSRAQASWAWYRPGLEWLPAAGYGLRRLLARGAGPIRRQEDNARDS